MENGSGAGVYMGMTCRPCHGCCHCSCRHRCRCRPRCHPRCRWCCAAVSAETAVGILPAFVCSRAPNVDDDDVAVIVFAVVDSRGVQGGPGVVHGKRRWQGACFCLFGDVVVFAVVDSGGVQGGPGAAAAAPAAASALARSLAR